MKKLNNFICTTTLLVLCVFSTSAQTVSKTFTKAFNVSGVNQIQLDIPGTIDLKTWDNPTIRFEITVNMPTGTSPSMLDELARVGRYNLTLTTQSDQTLIEAPNLKRTIKAKGQEIKENITFTIHAPKNALIVLPVGNILAEAAK